MPRIPRGQQAGSVYHVINRGNGRATIFHKAQDYFGLRLFQTFQEPALSSIEGFNRCAPFKPFSRVIRSSLFLTGLWTDLSTPLEKK
jgi:hypothetical protein